VPTSTSGVDVRLNRFTKDNPSPDAGLYYSFDVPGARREGAIASRRGRGRGARRGGRRGRMRRMLEGHRGAAVPAVAAPRAVPPLAAAARSLRPPACTPSLRAPPGTAHFIALTSYITNDTFGPDTKQYK
jgi:hypothetical protein